MTFSGEFSSGRLVVVGLDLFQPDSTVLFWQLQSPVMRLFFFVKEILTVFIQEAQTGSALEEERGCWWSTVGILSQAQSPKNRVLSLLYLFVKEAKWNKQGVFWGRSENWNQERYLEGMCSVQEGHLKVDLILKVQFASNSCIFSLYGWRRKCTVGGGFCQSLKANEEHLQRKCMMNLSRNSRLLFVAVAWSHVKKESSRFLLWKQKLCEFCLWRKIHLRKWSSTKSKTK